MDSTSSVMECGQLSDPLKPKYAELVEAKNTLYIKHFYNLSSLICYLLYF